MNDYGRKPTITFNQRLEKERQNNQSWLTALKQRVSSWESLAENLVTGLPDDKLIQEISQLNSDMNALRIAYSSTNKKCFHEDAAPNFPRLDIVAYPKMMRDSKKKLLVLIHKDKQLVASLPEYFSKKMHEMKSQFQLTKEAMQENIAHYENALKKNEIYENDLMVDIARLQDLYAQGPFKTVEIKFGRSHQLDLDLDDSKTICETISDINRIIQSPSIKNTISLEKKIKFSKNLERMYAVPTIPKAAYVEEGQDPAIIASKRVTHKENFAKALDAYYKNTSNAQIIAARFEASEFYQLSLFSKSKAFSQLYKKQIKTAKGLRSLILGLKAETDNALASKKIPHNTHAHLNEYYKNTLKKFKSDFSCIPQDHEIIKGIPESLIEIKKLLSKVSSKPTYMNIHPLEVAINNIHEEMKTFSIGEDKAYKKKYDELNSAYQDYYQKVNKTYLTQINSSDKTRLNKTLSQIKVLLSNHANNMQSIESVDQEQSIELLYNQFAQHYSNKDVSSLMSLIADNWSSSGDSITTMDLEDTLNNSFSIFDEIECKIYSLNIFKTANDTYSASYVISIKGFIYDEDIEHVEKSSVTEEIKIQDNIPKINKTLSGRYWKVQ